MALCYEMTGFLDSLNNEMTKADLPFVGTPTDDDPEEIVIRRDYDGMFIGVIRYWFDMYEGRPVCGARPIGAKLKASGQTYNDVVYCMDEAVKATKVRAWHE